jgi:hypothetical protein
VYDSDLIHVLECWWLESGLGAVKEGSQFRCGEVCMSCHVMSYHVINLDQRENER